MAVVLQDRFYCIVTSMMMGTVLDNDDYPNHIVLNMLKDNNCK